MCDKTSLPCILLLKTLLLKTAISLIPSHCDLENIYAMPTGDSDSTYPLNSNPSALSVAGLVVIPVAFFLCALPMALYVWPRLQSKCLAIRNASPPPVPEKDSHAHLVSKVLPKRAMEQNVAACITPVHSQWLAPAKEAGSGGGDGNAWNVSQDADHPIAQSTAGLESPVDPRSPFRFEHKHTSRFGLDLERAWPLPLQPVKIAQKDAVEQRLWRGSDCGSSWYSRPSSWYSVSNTGELGAVNRRNWI